MLVTMVDKAATERLTVPIRSVTDARRISARQFVRRTRLYIRTAFEERQRMKYIRRPLATSAVGAVVFVPQN